MGSNIYEFRPRGSALVRASNAHSTWAQCLVKGAQETRTRVGVAGLPDGAILRVGPMFKTLALAELDEVIDALMEIRADIQCAKERAALVQVEPSEGDMFDESMLEVLASLAEQRGMTGAER